MADNSSIEVQARFGQCVNCVCDNLANSPFAGRLLGLCPLLVVTTSVLKALGISILLLLVGVLSTTLGSLLRSMVHWRLKPVYFAVLASVSTLIVVNAVGIYFPALMDAMGIYALLLAANCQVISQLQELAEHNPLIATFKRVFRDGTWILVFAITLASIREFAAYGEIFHDSLLIYGLPTQDSPSGWLPFLAQPGGALIVFAVMLGTLNFMIKKYRSDLDIGSSDKHKDVEIGLASRDLENDG